MRISVRMNKKETALIKKYAELNGQTVSEVIRRAIFEKIEDEFDLRVTEQALKEARETPVTYSLEDIKKMLDID